MDLLAKDSVDVVEMGILIVQNEELRRISVGPPIGHRHDPPLIVPQRFYYFVVKEFAINRLTALPGPCRVAALHHKLFDIPVKHRPIVITRRAQSQKVLS
jgi:hypothetical protein